MYAYIYIKPGRVEQLVKIDCTIIIYTFLIFIHFNMALGLALPQGCLVAGTETTTRHGPYWTGAQWKIPGNGGGS